MTLYIALAVVAGILTIAIRKSTKYSQPAIEEKEEETESFVRDGFAIAKGKHKIVIQPLHERRFPPLMWVARDWSNGDHHQELQVNPYWTVLDTLDDNPILSSSKKWISLFSHDIRDRLRNFSGGALSPDYLVLYSENISEVELKEALAIANHFLTTDPIKQAFRNLLGDNHLYMLNVDIIKSDVKYEDVEGYLKCILPHIQPNKLFALIDIFHLNLDTYIIPILCEDSVRAVEMARFLRLTQESKPKDTLRGLMTQGIGIDTVYVEIIKGFALWGTPEDEDLMLHVLQKRKSPKIREQAVITLCRWGSERSSGFLIEQLERYLNTNLENDRQRERLKTLLRALERCGSVDAVEPLLALKMKLNKRDRLNVNITIDTIQTRLGEVEAGWLSVDRTSQSGNLSFPILDDDAA